MKTVRLDNNAVLVHGRDGYFLVNPNDQFIAQSLIHYGEYNYDEAKILNGLVQPGQCVVEVGANIGSHTIGLAKTVGPSGKVIAYEPQRHCYALLNSQVALNRLDNIWTYRLGVGTKADTFYLTPPDYAQTGNFGGLSLHSAAQAQSEAVQIVTLDEHLAGEKIDLIKVDVEGMEQSVLMGARESIKKYHPTLYIENDRVDKSQNLLQEIFSQDYKLWWHIPFLYSKDNFFKSPENIFGGIASFNVLCIHKSFPVQVEGLTPITSPDEPHPLRKS